MLNFEVDKKTCTQCGLCIEDCPSHIIAYGEDEFPMISADKEAACYRCQHCLAICPTGACSIFGHDPAMSRKLAGQLPDPEQIETLIKGRRSVRRYKDENLAPELLQRLLDVAWHAPSGKNARQVLFTVIDDREKLARFRDEVMEGLDKLIQNKVLPEPFGFFADFVRAWKERGMDIVFRGAPHFLVASAPQSVVTPVPDCIIALSYFELFAQSLGVGTVWDGIAKWAINDLVPSSRKRLGIPDDHVIGYTMVFGKPAVRFARTVQHEPALICRFPG